MDQALHAAQFQLFTLPNSLQCILSMILSVPSRLQAYRLCPNRGWCLSQFPGKTEDKRSPLIFRVAKQQKSLCIHTSVLPPNFSFPWALDLHTFHLPREMQTFCNFLSQTLSIFKPCTSITFPTPTSPHPNQSSPSPCPSTLLRISLPLRVIYCHCHWFIPSLHSPQPPLKITFLQDHQRHPFATPQVHTLVPGILDSPAHRAVWMLPSSISLGLCNTTLCRYSHPPTVCSWSFLSALSVRSPLKFLKDLPLIFLFCVLLWPILITLLTSITIYKQVTPVADTASCQTNVHPVPY